MGLLIKISIMKYSHKNIDFDTCYFTGFSSLQRAKNTHKATNTLLLYLLNTGIKLFEKETVKAMLEVLWIWTLITSLITLIVYLIGTWTHDHFSKRNVRSLKTVPFLGNMGPLALRSLSFPDFTLDIYNRLKGLKYGGVYEFMNPVVLLRDPELIKAVTVKDFEHFLNHRAPFPEETEPLFAKGLFNLQGEFFYCVYSSVAEEAKKL